MRIVQVLFPHATAYEQKCQRVDFAALSADHEVNVVSNPREAGDADVAHFYAPRNLGSLAFRGVKPPIVANVRPTRRWFSPGPAVAVSPVDEAGFEIVPEAVEEVYGPASAVRPLRSGPHILGSFARPGLKNIIEQTLVRIHRTRDDVDWLTFDAPPAPEELAEIDVWIDPAIDAADFDGFVAEAVASGGAVIASRIPINVQRLEKGRTGLLVPPNDPNELTHAILSALFKPEVAQQKIEAARQTMTKFRPRQRLRVLTTLYASLNR